MDLIMDERQEYTDKILNSINANKLIVAGAGTGKSFTFKKVLERYPGQKDKNLVLTFINKLVDDLNNDLGDFANVKTFHSFCRGLLHNFTTIRGLSSDFEYYPKLKQIIIKDAEIVKKFGGKTTDELEGLFDNAILNINDNEYLSYYIARANFYNAVSYNDSIFRVLKKFQEDESIIPSFNQVILDEYQDFNKLEVAIISFLLEKSNNFLIAGDDDQSVYFFREASPCHIRDLYKNESFSNFELPYCSRCTNVIIKIVNHIINKGVREGVLSNRIDKKYLYHEKSKRADSLEYPKLKKVNVTINTPNCPLIAKYILKEIDAVGSEEKKEAVNNNYPLGLVIGPPHYLEQIQNSLSQLIEDDRYNIAVYKKKRDKYSFPILDGLAHLFKNKDSKLGWRILLANENSDKLERFLCEGNLSPEFKAKWVDVIGKLKKEVSCDDPKEDEELIKLLGKNYLQKFIKILKRDEIEIDNIEEGSICDVTEKKPLIQFVTRVGGKGLSGGQVFIVGFEEGEYPKENPTFNDVCELIVSITRTRKQCHLIHVKKIFDFTAWKQPSSFFGWIEDNNYENIDVNADYFK